MYNFIKNKLFTSFLITLKVCSIILIPNVQKYLFSRITYFLLLISQGSTSAKLYISIFRFFFFTIRAVFHSNTFPFTSPLKWIC
ncbi:hypothetical protein GDO78_000910 [Eleutherodactylus coqui]|uniref:Uncharacterized protein n=1 Tax=Eleutherodactylus coqui TaxID=57060 RepID=A0A8J6KHR5_ELECQ|nr:hypothetical protein GDO78_000910 [Eleutherodactylus coqui]